MGELRKPKINEEKLETLSRIKDLRSALELMVDLQANHIFLEEKVVREYDKKTGKPVKYAWEPYKPFGTDFTFGGGYHGADVKVHLTDNVIDEIKKGPVCFDREGKRYVAKFEMRDHSGSDKDGPIYCVEHLVYLSEVRNL